MAGNGDMLDREALLKKAIQIEELAENIDKNVVATLEDLDRKARDAWKGDSSAMFFLKGEELRARLLADSDEMKKIAAVLRQERE